VNVALAMVAGLVVALVLVARSGPMLGHPYLERENYRGHRLPTAAGILLVVAVITVEAARVLLWLVGVDDTPTTSGRVLVVAAVVSFGFLGLIDDVLGDGGDRGLRGHVRALLRGRLTTGFVKLAAGAAMAMVLVVAAVPNGKGQAIVDGALIALAANLGNLFDRAPGRTIKVGLLAFVPLAVAAPSAAVVAVAPTIGAAVGLLPGDLRERFMLGDAGANALGAALGMAVVVGVGTDARTVVTAVLLGLTALSEVVSFSRVITAVPPLRALDELGRPAS
jgi:UDP-GlcNAc:undecaprenyl-phosphate/decaprenyl-phosphate GlcNAc-1-phosphate transferase